MTERLELRTPRLSDVPALFAFMGDAQAMQHTHTHETPRDLRRHLAGHRCQARKVGCGPWTVVERATGHIIGFGGLYDDPFDPGGWGVEIGYFFAPAAWGKGYASELAQAAIAAARAMGLPSLRAFAHPGNDGSRRVLTKAGFQQERFVPEMDRYLYALKL